jgi:hypothetical protein
MAIDNPPPLAMTGLMGCNGMAVNMMNMNNPALIDKVIGKENNLACTSRQTKKVMNHRM